MNPKVLVMIGGFYHLLWVLFHLYFPKLFNWNIALKDLDSYNKALMYIQSIFLLITFIIFSFAAIIFSNELLNTNLGKYLIASFSLFWLIRSIVQIYYFGIKDKKANIFLILFIFGFLIHLIPFIMVI